MGFSYKEKLWEIWARYTAEYEEHIKGLSLRNQVSFEAFMSDGAI